MVSWNPWEEEGREPRARLFPPGSIPVTSGAWISKVLHAREQALLLPTDGHQPCIQVSAPVRGAALREKLARLYEDKLSGDVGRDTYSLLRERFEEQLSEVERGRSSLSAAESRWRVDAERVFELCVSASDRFKQGGCRHPPRNPSISVIELHLRREVASDRTVD